MPLGTSSVVTSVDVMSAPSCHINSAYPDKHSFDETEEIHQYPTAMV